MPPLRRMAVLLDLDDTLIDSVPLILASVHHAFTGERRRPTDAEWIAGIGTPLRVQLEAWADGPEHLEAIVERYRAYQREHHDRMTRAYPGAVETVRALHDGGHPIAIVTGKLTDPAQRSLAFVGLAPFVRTVVGADSCRHHKPHPEPVLTALARVGAGPADAVFVGDSPIDIGAGNAAGVRTVAALWGACSREALAAARPTRLCGAITDLPALIDGITA